MLQSLLEVVYFGKLVKNKPMRVLIIFVMFFLLFSCSYNVPQATRERAFSIYQNGDTLKPYYPLPKDPNCIAIAEGFYTRFGIWISNYYEIEDVVPNGSNRNYYVDSFAILSPLSLIPTLEKGGNCNRENVDTFENRILLLISNQENLKIVAYPNAISNQATVAWQGYENVIPQTNGFELHGSKGQGHIFEYTIYIEFINENLFVQWIKLSETHPYREKTFKFKREELPFSSYKRELIDSLRAIDGL